MTDFIQYRHQFSDIDLCNRFAVVAGEGLIEVFPLCQHRVAQALDTVQPFSGGGLAPAHSGFQLGVKTRFIWMGSDSM